MWPAEEAHWRRRPRAAWRRGRAEGWEPPLHRTRDGHQGWGGRLGAARERAMDLRGGGSVDAGTTSTVSKGGT